MKVLVADKYEDEGIRQLKDIGCEVFYKPEAKNEKLVAEMQALDPEVLVVRSAKVTKEALEAGKKLSLVIRAGAGYNTIDVKTASALGIYVSNCPGKNSVAVAELAFGLMLALDRRIPDNVAQLRAGQWNKKEFSEARGLMGKTLGLIGLGSIGQEMIPRAKAFGMEVIGCSRSLTPEAADSLELEYRATPEQVAEDCDVLSVHLALNNDTRACIGASVFDRMRPGAFFINTSRAEVVDQPALEAAIKEKHLRAGLDVFANEPSGASGAFADSIVGLPGVYGTHHIGASTDQAQLAIASETTRIVKTFKEAGRAPNAVNLPSRSPASYLLVVRHRDRVGVLAHVLTILKENHVNVQEMENIVFEGAEAAIARILLDKTLQQSTLSAIKDGNPDILQLNLVAI